MCLPKSLMMFDGVCICRLSHDMFLNQSLLPGLLILFGSQKSFMQGDSHWDLLSLCWLVPACRNNMCYVNYVSFRYEFWRSWSSRSHPTVKYWFSFHLSIKYGFHMCPRNISQRLTQIVHTTLMSNYFKASMSS